jgi:hypothetical protein
LPEVVKVLVHVLEHLAEVLLAPWLVDDLAGARLEVRTGDPMLAGDDPRVFDKGCGPLCVRPDRLGG